MKYVQCFFYLVVFVATVSLSQPVFAELNHDFDNHGYFRTGVGASKGGSSQEAFIAPGAPAKYRLGNETETYGEFSLSDRVEQIKGEPFAQVKATVKIFGAQGDDIDLPEIMQLYAEVGNLTTVFGNPKIWIGRRLYDRHDIHINDYWFLNTLQEMDAGGVSGINLGIGKLSLAIGRDTAEGVSPSGLDITQSNIDVRLSDIPLNKNGTIMLWGLYSLSDGKDGVMSAAGWAGGIMHTQTEFFGGYNKFMLQYGTGLARKAGEGYGTAGLDSSLGKVLTSSDKDNLEEARTIRMTNQNVIEISDSWSLMTALVWESRDSKAFDGAEQDWLSLGVRPIFYVTDNFRVPVEVGYDYVDDKAADIDGALLKITLAAEASLAKGFWARPVARAFVTYADWAKDWQGQVGGSTFSGKSDGWSAGLQFETWW